MPRVVFLCWGNICRSTMAEQVCRAAAVEAGLEVEVDSAGTSREELGNPIDPRAAATLRAAGYDAGNHRARQITVDDVRAADLVVAMEPLHVDRLRQLTEAGGPRLDSSDSSDSSDSPDSSGYFADKVRLLTDFDPAAESGSGVPDPWYGPDSAFVETLEAIEAAVPGIVEALSDRAGTRSKPPG